MGHYFIYANSFSSEIRTDLMSKITDTTKTDSSRKSFYTFKPIHPQMVQTSVFYVDVISKITVTVWWFFFFTQINQVSNRGSWKSWFLYKLFMKFITALCKQIIPLGQYLCRWTISPRWYYPPIFRPFCFLAIIDWIVLAFK